MKKTLFTLLAIFGLTFSQAQSFGQRAIDVSIGLGISSPIDAVDYSGTGFYAQGEYVWSLTSWMDLRPYAGLILTRMTEEPTWPYQAGDRSTANAFLFGGKARYTIPIPWVAPYMEIGLGGSMGTFETVTPKTNIKESGLIAHIPFSLGLELGPQHNVNIEFTYYFVPAVKQFAGAAAIGLSFPIGDEKPR